MCLLATQSHLSPWQGIPVNAGRHLLQFGANTTSAIGGTFVPGPGKTQAQANAYLQTLPDLGGGLRDLCDATVNNLSICQGTEIYAAQFILPAVARAVRRLLEAGVRV